MQRASNPAGVPAPAPGSPAYAAAAAALAAAGAGAMRTPPAVAAAVAATGAANAAAGNAGPSAGAAGGAGATAPRVPRHHDRVFKSECAFCYDTPESAGGLFVNLATHVAFSADHVALDRKRTGCSVYLHQQWRRVPKAAPDAPTAAADAAGANAPAPVKFGIGIEGGFATEAQTWEYAKTHSIVVFTAPAPDVASCVAFPFPEAAEALPSSVVAAAEGVLAHEDVGVQQAAATWEDEAKPSKYADALIQVDNGVHISPNPADWKCGDCDKRDNLWLNLSDGYIGCGRRNFDGTGGNGHALAHFQASNGLHPLCVKLGTITPSGADVYSYAPNEDDMVTDPKLADHLAHWGINAMAMTKSEKTMAELNIDLNMKYDFSRISESGKKLVPVSGPGFIGLDNLGNSCYMNSCLQVLATLPETRALYGEATADALFDSAGRVLADDLLAQMAKLTNGMLTGRYALEPEAIAAARAAAVASRDQAQPAVGAAKAAPAGPPVTDAAAVATSATATVHAATEPGAGTHCGYIVPRAFKTLAGAGHPEFSSARQQDAIQFLEYLLTLLEKAHHGARNRAGAAPAAGITPLHDVFSFTQEVRLQCLQSNTVRYSTARDKFLRLSIPVDAATNKEEVAAARAAADAAAAAAAAKADAVSPESAAKRARLEPTAVPPLKVPFEACVASYVSPGTMDDFLSPATGRRGTALQSHRFASFPRYLAVQLGRYTMAADWTVKKIDALVPMPDAIDLEAAGLKARGRQPDEPEMPSEAPAAPAAAAAAPTPDAGIVAQLESMGFPDGACKRAAVAVKNVGAEAALDWLTTHMDDPDFADPYVPPAAAPAPAAAGAPAPAATFDESSISMLCDMGFERPHAIKALKATDGNLERAAEWIFSHPADEDVGMAAESGAASGGAGANAGAAAAVADANVNAPSKYQLVGFISHMGSSTASGHYVCHIRKTPDGQMDKRDGSGGRWYIFNDSHVAESEDPPLDMGYIYVYKRIDV